MDQTLCQHSSFHQEQALPKKNASLPDFSVASFSASVDKWYFLAHSIEHFQTTQAQSQFIIHRFCLRHITS